MPTASSPIKRRLPITQHRQGLSQQLETTGAISPSSILASNHLLEAPKELQKRIVRSIKGSVTKFVENKSESSGYIAACRVLNKISEKIQGAYLALRPNLTLILRQQIT
jgi:hypothetical protein